MSRAIDHAQRVAADLREEVDGVLDKLNLLATETPGEESLSPSEEAWLVRRLERLHDAVERTSEQLSVRGGLPDPEANGHFGED